VAGIAIATAAIGIAATAAIGARRRMNFFICKPSVNHMSRRTKDWAADRIDRSKGADRFATESAWLSDWIPQGDDRCQRQRVRCSQNSFHLWLLTDRDRRDDAAQTFVTG
jgi:hypothetical protein